MMNLNRPVRQYNKEKAVETFKGLGVYEALELLDAEGMDLYTITEGLSNGIISVQSFDGATFYDMSLYLKNKTVELVEFDTMAYRGADN